MIDLFFISLLKPQISQITQINKKQILQLRTGSGYKIEPAKVNHRNTEGLTINNLNKFVVRYFEDQALRQAQYRHCQG